MSTAVAMTGTRVLGSLLAVLACCSVPDIAAAQGRLEAQYIATLAGIPIGKGNWTVDVGESRYSAAASGMTTGLVRLFTGGRATGAAQGSLSPSRPLASSYAATIVTRHQTDEIRLTVAAGNVKEVKVEPPEKPDPKRIPVTDEQRRGVVDPMTASLMLVPANVDLQSPQACERRLAVFDGKLRYNLTFAFKRMEKVAAKKGYAGAAVVCSVAFEPVSGFVPDRSAIAYLSKPHGMEVWLVPIPGTRVLVPFRGQIETPVGLGVVEATQFVAAAGSAHAAKRTKGASVQDKTQ